MKVGDRLRQLRRHLGVNQCDFAESIGLKQGSYSDIERGRSGLSNHVKMSLSEKYNVNIDWLVSGEGNMFINEFEEFDSPNDVPLKERIKEFANYLNISIRKFESSCGLSNGFVNNIGKSVGQDKVEKILNTYPELNEQWLMNGVGNMLNSTSKQENEVSYGDFIVMNVPLVGQYAYGGYLCGYQDETYVAQLPRIPFVVDHEARGRYVAFEMRGDSMTDDTGRYIEGDILLCREVPQDLWCQTKLHMRKWDFVIVHKEGILIKRVVNHDVENHKLTLHSLNPMYPDRIVDLVDVRQIFNVVKLQRGMQI